MRRQKKIGQKKFTEANFSNLVTYLLSILWAKLDMRILQRLALKLLRSIAPEFGKQ